MEEDHIIYRAISSISWFLLFFVISCFSASGLASGEVIVFESDREGNDEIYRVDPEGKQAIRLTHDPGRDQHPRLSPDRRQVVFMSDRDGNFEIYVMDIEGRNLRRLTDHPGIDQQPNWFPDGEKIVFTSDRAGAGNLYAMKPDGSDLRPLSTFRSGWLGTPAVSPDGKRIAVTSRGPGGRGWRAAVFDLENGDLTWIAPGPRGNCRPAWSPDGNLVAFIQHATRRNTELCLHDRCAGEDRYLTDHPGKDYNPDFSPDGRKIVYQSQKEGGKYQLYMFDLEKGESRLFLTSSGNDQSPDWR